MKLFGRKGEAEKRCDAAKIELAAAAARLAVIDAGEIDALANSQTFAAWSEKRSAAAAEIDRLERLTAALAAGGDAERKHEADEALRKRIDAAQKNNAAVAERLRTEGAKIALALKDLARAVAISQVETDAVNRLLPDGVPALQDANYLARGRPAVPREDISVKTLSLWVRATDGSLIGEQDRVVEADARSGYLIVDKSYRIDCIRRVFRSIQYYPADYVEVPEPFHRTLRIPHMDRHGIDFDGQFMIEQELAALELAPPKVEKKPVRIIQTELAPTGPWPVTGTSNEAA